MVGQLQTKLEPQSRNKRVEKSTEELAAARKILRNRANSEIHSLLVRACTPGADTDLSVAKKHELDREQLVTMQSFFYPLDRILNQLSLGGDDPYALTSHTELALHSPLLNQVEEQLSWLHFLALENEALPENLKDVIYILIRFCEQTANVGRADNVAINTYTRQMLQLQGFTCDSLYLALAEIMPVDIAGELVAAAMGEPASQALAKFYSETLLYSVRMTQLLNEKEKKIASTIIMMYFQTDLTNVDQVNSVLGIEPTSFVGLMERNGYPAQEIWLTIQKLYLLPQFNDTILYAYFYESDVYHNIAKMLSMFISLIASSAEVYQTVSAEG